MVETAAVAPVEIRGRNRVHRLCREPVLLCQGQLVESRRIDGDAGRFALTFQSEKDEVFVLTYWPADRAAELLASIVRLGTAALLGEIVVGIHHLIAIEEIERTMQLIRSALSDRGDQRAFPAPIARREPLRADLNLFNR